MPSYQKYQNEYKKRQKSKDQFSKPKNMTLRIDIDKEREDNLIEWITFYRRNVHRFVQHYFGIKLYPYQIIWLYLMSFFDSFVAIASRAVGKTWLVGVFSCAIAVLYPDSKIVVVASTKEQAGKIISEKITELRENHPNLAREISNIVTNSNKREVQFHNGSRIVAVAPIESSRGGRATFLIFEEFRLIDEDTKRIISPYKVVRQPPYLKEKKYIKNKNLIEEAKEVYISSAHHKGAWWYQQTIKKIKSMLAGESTGFIATDYLVAIEHNIQTKKQIDKEREDMDEITFLEEYENIPWGESEDAFLKLSMFNDARNVKKAFYPQKDHEYKARNPNGIKRIDGEIRLVSVDIATRGGTRNDNTIIKCMRLLPTQKGYRRIIPYLESHNGANTVIQNLRIKQIFNDFDGDYLVLDVANAGIGIYDQLGTVTQDDARGTEYKAFTVMDHYSIEKKDYQELYDRTLATNALPIIYPISGNPSLNSEINVALRDRLQKKMFSFLINENKADDYLFKSNEKFSKNIDGMSEKAILLHPYFQTSLLVNECIGLSMKVVGGNIKLEEPAGSRKDRYTALAYANYFASLLDAELLRDGRGDSMQEMLEAIMVL